MQSTTTKPATAPRAVRRGRRTATTLVALTFTLSLGLSVGPAFGLLGVASTSTTTTPPVATPDDTTPVVTPPVTPPEDTSPGPEPVPDTSDAPAPKPPTQPAPKPAPKPAAKPQAAPKPPPAPTGRIVGRAVDISGSGIAGAHVALFDSNWRWIRDVKARHTGRFTLKGVTPGTYILQVSDGRPAWRTDRRAPSDTRVRVRAHRDAVRTVTLRRGGFVTGQVTRGRDNRGARRATIRATDKFGRSHTVRADHAGMFALGGLPRGKYQIWGYDAGHQWVGPSVTVNVRGAKHAGHLTVRLRSRAGGVNGFVFEGGELARRTTWVTAVNRRTGQWWVTKARGGDLSFRGLAPGRYTFTLTGTSAYAGRTIKSNVRVKAGRTSHVTLRLNQRLKK